MRAVVCFCFMALVPLAWTVRAQGWTGFTGNLLVRTDTGDTLPVWIDGKYVGTTPLSTECPVGTRTVSFMEPRLQDSILAGQIDYEKHGVPSGLRVFFDKSGANPKAVFPAMAQYASMQVTVKNVQRTEAIINVTEVLQSIKARKSAFYMRFVIGGVIIVGVSVAVIAAAY
jgi:hypothetical protein